MSVLTALREFPGPNTGRRNGSWVSQTPWQEVMKLTVWWTKVGRDHRSEPRRGESGTERKRTLEIWGGAPRVFSRGTNRAHLGKTTWDQGETIWKDYRNLWLVLTQSQEFYLFSWARLEKLLGTSRMNRVVSKVWPPRQEIISPSPRAPLDAPNTSWEARAQKDLWKTLNIWKLNHTDLNNPWIKKVMKRESTKYFELKENENVKTSRHFRELTSWF